MKLVDKLNLKLNKDFPLETFNKLKKDKRQSGIVEDWKYFVHGYHCGFENKKTGQVVEVSIVFGQEFGCLDPYFFSNYIKSTPTYRPLPVDILDDFADGVRILEKMISLGKFEKINSNINDLYGTLVTDRQKFVIKSYFEIDKHNQIQDTKSKKSKFINLFKFFSLRTF